VVQALIGLMSITYRLNSDSLQLWDKQVKSGISKLNSVSTMKLKTLVIDNHEPMGVNLLPTRCGRGTYVNQFKRVKGENGSSTLLLAERSGLVQIGDSVHSINGLDAANLTLDQTRDLCSTDHRPLIVCFQRCEMPLNLMRLLGDVRKLNWMTDYFTKENRTDIASEIKLTQAIHNIIVALSCAKEPYFDGPCEALTDCVLNVISRHNDMNDNMEEVLSILHRKTTQHTSTSEMFSALLSTYNPLRLRFERYVYEFLQTPHGRRMIAHYSCDPDMITSIDSVASFWLHGTATANLYIFCAEHNWYVRYVHTIPNFLQFVMSGTRNSDCT
jgi:hypothetical protein